MAQINWEAVARTEIHSLRVKLLEAIARASQPCSPVQLSNAFDMPIGNVSYHVKALAKAGLIEIDREVPRRGALEHLYRLAPKAEQR